MIRKFIVCSDFDDTMVDLLGAWVAYLNNKFNLDINIEEVTSWNMNLVYPTLTDDELYSALNDPEFWLTVKPKDNAVKYIKWLVEDKNTDFYVCTSTHHDIAPYKFKNCLYRLFPFIDRHKIIITYNKQLINCDVLVDDGSHNIVGNYHGVLMDMPHNRTVYAENVTRVHNWSEAYYDIMNEQMKWRAKK